MRAPSCPPPQRASGSTRQFVTATLLRVRRTCGALQALGTGTSSRLWSKTMFSSVCFPMRLRSGNAIEPPILGGSVISFQFAQSEHFPQRVCSKHRHLAHWLHLVQISTEQDVYPTKGLFRAAFIHSKTDANVFKNLFGHHGNLINGK